MNFLFQHRLIVLSDLPHRTHPVDLLAVVFGRFANCFQFLLHLAQILDVDTAITLATNIVDEVLVPESLQPGPHLLSWRWVRVPACLSLGWMLGAEDACCAGL